MLQVLLKYVLNEWMNVIHYRRLCRGRMSKEDIFKCGLGAGAAGMSANGRQWMDNETFCDS